ncbi:hypothetical protein [Aristophania vespae]|uniref:hypothetical protein n=1 Tax=Aristophania vespae TaxID=2697033 RepID=UPI0023518375|nr:hypothetical protein [Aristophania vespae]UMM64255.1 hypothetical protein DM15PD_12650 [Aristophania vespae]
MTLQKAVISLNTLLETGISATAMLQSFCARSLRVEFLTPTPFPLKDYLHYLEPNNTEKTPLYFRHIQLFDENILLSEAWNVYRADYLAPEAQSLLEKSTIPFGAAIGKDFFRRQPLKSRYLNDNPHSTGHSENFVLEHHALLRRQQDHKIFSIVLERYSAEAAHLCYRASST